MSIAEDEAREEYWNEIGLQAVMLRTAYVAGRTAEPCKEQIEAVAKILATSYLTVAQRENVMEIAKRLLYAARDAVKSMA